MDIQTYRSAKNNDKELETEGNESKANRGKNKENENPLRTMFMKYFT